MEEGDKYKPPTNPIQWRVTRLRKPPYQDLPSVTIFKMGKMHYDVINESAVELKCGKEFIEAVPDPDWQELPSPPTVPKSGPRQKKRRARR